MKAIWSYPVSHWKTHQGDCLMVISLAERNSKVLKWVKGGGLGKWASTSYYNDIVHFGRRRSMIYDEMHWERAEAAFFPCLTVVWIWNKIFKSYMVRVVNFVCLYFANFTGDMKFAVSQNVHIKNLCSLTSLVQILGNQIHTSCLETAIAPLRVYEVVHMVSPTDWWVNT